MTISAAASTVSPAATKLRTSQPCIGPHGPYHDIGAGLRQALPVSVARVPPGSIRNRRSNGVGPKVALNRTTRQARLHQRGGKRNPLPTHAFRSPRPQNQRRTLACRVTERASCLWVGVECRKDASARQAGKEVIDRMMLPPVDTVPDARMVAAARKDGAGSFLQAAEQQVREWAATHMLPFPEFDGDYRKQIMDSLDYPPEGSPGVKRRKVNTSVPGAETRVGCGEGRTASVETASRMRNAIDAVRRLTASYIELERGQQRLLRSCGFNQIRPY